MVDKVDGNKLFHVTRIVPYNPHPYLEIESKIETNQYNPFFDFYQKARSYSVNTDQGPVDVKAIRFLTAVKNGEISSTILPVIAHEVAQHYLLLARELIMEEVRLKVQSDAPSRKTCLWVVETIEQARYWKQRLGGEKVQVFELELFGLIHKADAALLLGDSEPLSVTYERANAYWRGEMSENPEPEVLFQGNATIVRGDIE